MVWGVWDITNNTCKDGSVITQENDPEIMEGVCVTVWTGNKIMKMVQVWQRYKIVIGLYIHTHIVYKSMVALEFLPGTKTLVSTSAVNVSVGGQ